MLILNQSVVQQQPAVWVAYRVKAFASSEEELWFNPSTGQINTPKLTHVASMVSVHHLRPTAGLVGALPVSIKK